VKIKHGSAQKLEKKISVSRNTISKAINGRNHNELCYKIREAAVELGGDPIFGDVTNSKVVLHLNQILAKRFNVTTQSIRNARRNITKGF
jgi:hypothetical protein